MDSMLKLVTLISIFYLAFACDPEEATPWSPESSLFLRSLGWNPPYFFDVNEPVIDDNDELESFHFVGGDIISGEEDGEDRTAISGKNKIWPKGIIPYIISSKLSDRVKDIRDAMKYIESVTCIRFVPRTVEKNYVRIYKGQGCNSHVGMSGGAQDISLGSGCYKRGKIMHELLHAVGFFHEQSRSDRDQYINIHWENIQKGHEKNFDKMKPSQELLLTPYDYDSIMHYSEYSFSKDKAKGLKTMTAKLKGAALISPGEKVLSKSDIKRISILYKC